MYAVRVDVAHRRVDKTKEEGQAVIITLSLSSGRLSLSQRVIQVEPKVSSVEGHAWPKKRFFVLPAVQSLQLHALPRETGQGASDQSSSGDDVTVSMTSSVVDSRTE